MEFWDSAFARLKQRARDSLRGKFVATPVARLQHQRSEYYRKRILGRIQERAGQPGGEPGGGPREHVCQSRRTRRRSLADFCGGIWRPGLLEFFERYIRHEFEYRRG